MGAIPVTISGTPLPHESARGHVTGEALYVDDLCGRYPNLLHAWPVCAPHAHALVTELDTLPALQEPGVVTVLTQSDVPGEADTGANRHDEPLFPVEVLFHQPANCVGAGRHDGGCQARRRARHSVVRAAAGHPYDRAGDRGRQLPYRSASDRRWRHRRDRCELRSYRGRAEDRRPGAFLSRDPGGARVDR